MDMAVEYRKTFGPIEPGMSWHEVLSHVRRVRGLEMRERLILAEGAVLSQPGASEGVDSLQRRSYERLAYPEMR